MTDHYRSYAGASDARLLAGLERQVVLGHLPREGLLDLRARLDVTHCKPR